MEILKPEEIQLALHGKILSLHSFKISEVKKMARTLLTGHYARYRGHRIQGLCGIPKRPDKIASFAQGVAICDV